VEKAMDILRYHLRDGHEIYLDNPLQLMDYLFHTKDSRLMKYTEMTAVYSEDCTKPVITFCINCRENVILETGGISRKREN
jgi:hypothetical protein